MLKEIKNIYIYAEYIHDSIARSFMERKLFRSILDQYIYKFELSRKNILCTIIQAQKTANRIYKAMNSSNRFILFFCNSYRFHIINGIWKAVIWKHVSFCFSDSFSQCVDNNNNNALLSIGIFLLKRVWMKKNLIGFDIVVCKTKDFFTVFYFLWDPKNNVSVKMNKKVAINEICFSFSAINLSTLCSSQFVFYL